MKYFRLLLLGIYILSMINGTTQNMPNKKVQFHYPATKTVDQADTFWGNIVKDPYRWLEEMKNKETVNWVLQQDSLLRDYLASTPHLETVKKRITALTPFAITTTPKKVGRYLYYSITDKDQSLPDFYRQEVNNNNIEKIINHTTFRIEKPSSMNVTGYSISNKGRYLTYNLSQPGSRWFSTGIYDLAQKKQIQGTIEAMHTLGGGIVWDASDDGFYYIRFKNPEKGKELSQAPIEPQVYYHNINSSPSTDVLIYRPEQGSKALLTINISDNGRFLIIDHRTGSNTNTRIFIADLLSNKKIIPLFTDENANYAFLGTEGDYLFFYTNHMAPKGKVIKVKYNDTKVISQVIAETKDPIMGGSLTGGNVLGYFGEHFIIGYSRDLITNIKVFDKNGTYKHTLDLPLEGSVWGNLMGTQDDPVFYFRFLGFTSPNTVFSCNINTGKIALFKKASIDFDDSRFETKQVFYTSKDGIKIPMFVTHKKGIKLDGTNPAFIYGYGALNWKSFLWYQPHLLVWLEMGGIYAQPGIRGGGEYGEEWHVGGMLHNRQNAINDYISACEWLITKKYTSTKNLVLNGGSASGPLAGAVYIQRPDLFGAAVIDRPAFDMLRYLKFTTASYWGSEFGDPEKNVKEFNTLYAYSPYHNIKSGICYPPLLVMQGDKDQVTAPLHAYKFIAKLQANQVASCMNPFLLKMMWGAGHNFGTTPKQNIDSRTAEILFLIKTLNLQPPRLSNKPKKVTHLLINKK